MNDVGGFETTIREFLASGEARDAERLRALLLDCPASVRRQQRGVVPALVAAFAEGIDTAPRSGWTEISKQIAETHAFGEPRASEAMQIWAVALGNGPGESSVSVTSDSVDTERTPAVQDDGGQVLERVGDRLRSGSTHLGEILGSDDPQVGDLRVGVVLQTIHGVGPATARKVLIASGVDLDVRVDQLSEDQRDAVCAALARKPARTVGPDSIAVTEAVVVDDRPIASRRVARRRQQIESISVAGYLVAFLGVFVAILGGVFGVFEAGGDAIAYIVLFSFVLGGLSFAVGAIVERIGDDER